MNRRALVMGGGVAAVVASAFVILRSIGSFSDYERIMVAERRAPLPSNADFKQLVRYASLAANGHNTQPWKFRIENQAIGIIPDFGRRTPVVDPDDHHLFVSLGCAAENLALASQSIGWMSDLAFQSNRSVTLTLNRASPATSELFAAIPLRQSTRANFDGRSVSAEDIGRLELAASEPGVASVIVTDPAVRSRVRDLVVAGNTTQMADAAFVSELKNWMRFNARSALASGDGLFSVASGNPSLPTWLASLLFPLVFTTTAENDKYAGQLASSAGVIVFAADKPDAEHWVKVGRACQRFALQATALGLKHSFINQPVEVASLRPELAQLAGLGERRPDIVMRFGYGPQLPFSPRRPVDAIIV